MNCLDPFSSNILSKFQYTHYQQESLIRVLVLDKYAWHFLSPVKSYLNLFIWPFLFSLTVCMPVHKLGIHVKVFNVWTA